MLGLLSLGFRYYVVSDQNFALWATLPSYFSWFALGMAMAVISVGPVAPRLVAFVTAHPAACWLVAALGYVLLSIVLRGVPQPGTYYTTGEWMFQHVVAGVVAVALVAPAAFGAAAGGWPRRVMAWRWLAAAGLVSYGVYLWQGAWVEQAAKWASSWGFAARAPTVPGRAGRRRRRIGRVRRDLLPARRAPADALQVPPPLEPATRRRGGRVPGRRWLSVTPDVVAPPPGHPRFAGMDALRAFAAIAVLVSHVGAAAQLSQQGFGGALIGQGITGVTIFFVLSGFLLYRPFLAAQLDELRPVRLLDYAPPARAANHPRLLAGPDRDRAVVARPRGLRSRLVALLLPRPELLGADGRRRPRARVDAVRRGVVLPAAAVLRRGAGPRLRVGAHARPGSVSNLRCLAVLGLASLGLYYASRAGDLSATLYLTLPTTFLWFALGMALAVISVGPVAPRIVAFVRAHPGWCWLAAGALYVVMSFALRSYRFYSADQWTFQFVVSALVAIALVAPAALGHDAGGWPRRLLASRPLALLGLVSYGIYLWQTAWIAQLSRWGVDGFVGLLAGAVALTIAVAAVSYVFLERPLMRFKNPRRASEPPATRDTAAAPVSGRAPVPDTAPGSRR